MQVILHYTCRDRNCCHPERFAGTRRWNQELICITAIHRKWATIRCHCGVRCGCHRLVNIVHNLNLDWTSAEIDRVARASSWCRSNPGLTIWMRRSALRI